MKPQSKSARDKDKQAVEKRAVLQKENGSDKVGEKEPKRTFDDRATPV